MTTISVERYLESLRGRHGEDAWRSEIQRLALAALHSGLPEQEAFWRNLTEGYDWLDWAQLKQQAEVVPVPPSTDRLIAETLKSQLPGIKTQAQYDAVVSALEAMQHVVNAILERRERAEREWRNALEVGFDTIAKATELTLKLEDVPEASSSADAQRFKEAPLQFHEADLHAELMKELAVITTLEALQVWYEVTRPRRDKIASQSLRNELIDAVRAKKGVVT